MKLEKSDVIWFNGEFVAWDEARIHVLSHGLHYASSVFEGLRAYGTPGGPAIVGLEAHVRRLVKSCALVEMPLPYSEEQLTKAICETVSRNGMTDGCYVRPIVFRGYEELGVDPRGCPVECAIAVWPHGSHFGAEALELGITAAVSSWRRMAPDTHPAMVKSAANYLNSQLALLEARRHGYDDAIILDVDGFACETHGANLFVVLDGVIHTPPIGESILAGVTRANILQLARAEGLPIAEQRLPREFLATADEVFVTGTAAEVTPVRELDGRPIGTGVRGPITERLQSAYLQIVRGQMPDRFGWLTLLTGTS